LESFTVESNFRKYTSLSFLSLSAICAYVLYLIFTQIADFARIGGSNVFETGLSWPVVGGSAAGLLGLVMFIVLMTNSKALHFSDDVFVELSKTTWPTLKETGASTVVVSILVLISAIVLLLMDMLWGSVFGWLI